MTTDLTKEQLEKEIAAYRGNPLFAELANLLRREARFDEALSVCLEGLSSNPKCHKGRLQLARIFYEKDCLPFAIRELELLAKELPRNSSVLKLIEMISPSAAKIANIAAGAAAVKDQPVIEKTLAEAEFDMDLLADMGDKKKD